MWLLGLLLSAMVHAAARAPAILIMGDSLSAGYGVSVDATWVSLLQQRLDAEGYEYQVVNASVSGETTGGARSRLGRALQLHAPAIVVLELGGNDGLRALPLNQIRQNLEDMITRSQQAGAKVLVAGMRIPPNYGPAYAESFHRIFGELAKKHGIANVEFFLEGVALDESLMQADGIHPNAAAQSKLLDNLWPALKPLLKK